MTVGDVHPGGGLRGDAGRGRGDRHRRRSRVGHHHSDGGGARRRPIAGQTRWRQALIAWSFALPFLILFAVFMPVPIVAAVVDELHRSARRRDIRNPLGVDFIGVDNYVDVLTDPKFHKAAGNTVVYVLVGVPLTMASGLLAAVGLNQGVVKLRDAVPGRLLPAGRDEHRGHRGRVAAAARH